MTDEETEAAVLAAGDKLEAYEVDGIGKTLGHSISSVLVGKRVVYTLDSDGNQTGFVVEDV